MQNHEVEQQPRYVYAVTDGALAVPPAAGTGNASGGSGGIDGIIIDNDSTSTGAASVYFPWLAKGNQRHHLFVQRDDGERQHLRGEAHAGRTRVNLLR